MGEVFSFTADYCEEIKSKSSQHLSSVPKLSFITINVTTTKRFNLKQCGNGVMATNLDSTAAQNNILESTHLASELAGQIALNQCLRELIDAKDKQIILLETQKGHFSPVNPLTNRTTKRQKKGE